MAKCMSIDEYEALKAKTADHRISPPFLTKFELTSIKGMRLQQLYDGAPTVLTAEERSGLSSLEEIVEREIQTKKVPVMVLRTLAGGEQELWRFEDLLRGASPPHPPSVKTSE